MSDRMNKPENSTKTKLLRHAVILLALSISTSIWSPETFANDPDIEALMPKPVPGHELSWLNGRWSKNDTQCTNEKSIYISFSATRDGLYAITGPEPKKTESMAHVQGRAQANPGERGFTNITPPDWDDAYFRVKENENVGLDIELVEFDPSGPDWKVTDTFILRKCE